jgi:abhydrolase domain-containing protein 1/3
VVFNFRGRGGLTLTTPRTYCACNGEDIDEVLAHIRSTHPGAPLMAVGVSLGGILLGNYLVQQGDRARDKLRAAMVISVCWDTVCPNYRVSKKKR